MGSIVSSENEGPVVFLPKNAHHLCTCGHLKHVHSKAVGSCNSVPCRCQGFVCDHSRCGWKPHEDKPKPCTCGPDEGCGDDCAYQPRCDGCGHTEGEGCGCPPQEPPLTPEEEEQAPEDWHCMHKGGCSRLLEGACLQGCRDAADELSREANEMDPSPPQPDRRPPFAVTYSVQGHLYEVALPGDAAVRAVDGALVIQHHLGPVAGIVQVLPVINEEQDRV